MWRDGARAESGFPGWDLLFRTDDIPEEAKETEKTSRRSS